MTARDEFPTLGRLTIHQPTYLSLSEFDELGRALDLIDDLRRQLAAAEAERDRFREHSVLLNTVAWRISEAIGVVPEGADTIHDRDIVADLATLRRQLADAKRRCQGTAQTLDEVERYLARRRIGRPPPGGVANDAWMPLYEAAINRAEIAEAELTRLRFHNEQLHSQLDALDDGKSALNRRAVAEALERQPGLRLSDGQRSAVLEGGHHPAAGVVSGAPTKSNRGDRVKALLDLPANWDSYRGKRITLGAATSVQLFLAVIDPEVEPAIVPCGDGGLQMEWHTADAQIEISVSPGGELEVWMDQTPPEARSNRGTRRPRSVSSPSASAAANG